MKKLAAFILLLVMGMSCAALARAQISPGALSESRAARKADKKQQKAMKKYQKAQRKAQRKMEKKDRKNTHYPPRSF
ncbi:MAG: hypothetical protein WCA16_09045 [Candidatus Sulfotelmatobacter sp.]